MAACDAEIAEAEEAFSRVSLEAALSEDRTIGQAEFGQLAALRRRKDLLSDGLRAALEAETRSCRTIERTRVPGSPARPGSEAGRTGPEPRWRDRRINRGAGRLPQARRHRGGDHRAFASDDAGQHGGFRADPRTRWFAQALRDRGGTVERSPARRGRNRSRANPAAVAQRGRLEDRPYRQDPGPTVQQPAPAL